MAKQLKSAKNIQLKKDFDVLKNGNLLLFVFSGVNSNGVFCKTSYLINPKDISLNGEEKDEKHRLMTRIINEAEYYLHEHGVNYKEVVIIDFKNFSYEYYNIDKYREYRNYAYANTKESKTE